MTAKTFRFHLMFAIASLLLASATTLIAGSIYVRISDASRAAIPVYIAIGAAWLTFALQRRVAFTNALRPLWDRIVDTVHSCQGYINSDMHPEDEYKFLIKNLCCRIDEIRAVFRNVDEKYRAPSTSAKVFVRSVKHSKNFDHLALATGAYAEDTSGRGLYPFESQKQIHAVVERLGSGPSVTKEQTKIAAKAISLLWSILKAELLKEMDRDYPEFPDTPYTQGKSGPRPQRQVAEAMTGPV
jgi:hypothetical protein